MHCKFLFLHLGSSGEILTFTFSVSPVKQLQNQIFKSLLFYTCSLYDVAEILTFFVPFMVHIIKVARLKYMLAEPRRLRVNKVFIL